MNYITNLQKVYLTIINLLKDHFSLGNFASIYIKLSLIYLNKNDIEKAENCLVLSQEAIK